MMQRIFVALRITRNRAYISAIAFVGIALTSAVAGGWVFRLRPGEHGSSVWERVVSDRWTVGSVRLAIVAAGIYAAASAAALITSGRWIRSVSSSGLETDEPHLVERQIKELQDEVRRLEDQRDRAFRLFEERLGG